MSRILQPSASPSPVHLHVKVKVYKWVPSVQMGAKWPHCTWHHPPAPPPPTLHSIHQVTLNLHYKHVTSDWCISSQWCEGGVYHPPQPPHPCPRPHPTQRHPLLPSVSPVTNLKLPLVTIKASNSDHRQHLIDPCCIRRHVCWLDAPNKWVVLAHLTVSTCNIIAIYPTFP